MAVISAGQVSDLFGLAVMRIRHVVPADAPAWVRLRQELWPEEDDTHRNEVEQFFRGELPELLAVLLAESDHGQVIGIVELSIRQDVAGCSLDRVGYVEGLYVVPDWRHQGVARALLRASRAWIEQRGCGALASDRAGRAIVDRHHTGAVGRSRRTS